MIEFMRPGRDPGSARMRAETRGHVPREDFPVELKTGKAKLFRRKINGGVYAHGSY